MKEILGNKGDHVRPHAIASTITHKTKSTRQGWIYKATRSMLRSPQREGVASDPACLVCETACQIPPRARSLITPSRPHLQIHQQNPSSVLCMVMARGHYSKNAKSSLCFWPAGMSPAFWGGVTLTRPPRISLKGYRAVLPSLLAKQHVPPLTNSAGLAKSCQPFHILSYIANTPFTKQQAVSSCGGNPILRRILPVKLFRKWRYEGNTS